MLGYCVYGALFRLLLRRLRRRRLLLGALPPGRVLLVPPRGGMGVDGVLRVSRLTFLTFPSLLSGAVAGLGVVGGPLSRLTLLTEALDGGVALLRRSRLTFLTFPTLLPEAAVVVGVRVLRLAFGTVLRLTFDTVLRLTFGTLFPGARTLRMSGAGRSVVVLSGSCRFMVRTSLMWVS